ncbi:hypothetical protein [Cronobacter sakazakii]|nr:hypothetical protein [Cronobacter sakazakii]
MTNEEFKKILEEIATDFFEGELCDKHAATILEAIRNKEKKDEGE